jgi:alpha-beta hydrolase superfamily lysophospholipase
VRGYHPSQGGYLADVVALARHAAEACPPGTPLFAYAESMGATLLLQALASKPELQLVGPPAVLAG